MPKLVICTGSDTNLFYLAKGLILSLRRLPPFYDAELAFFDLGCTAQELAWLEARTHRILKPKDDFGISSSPDFKSYMLGQTCRPFLPSYVPGFENYMWIDADAWVQSPAIIASYLSAANTGKMSIAPELDVSYRWFFSEARRFHGYKVNQWSAAFGAEVASRHALAPLLNSGAFATAGHSSVWAAWAENLSLSFRHGVQHLSEQLALQKTLIETNMLNALPSRANWMSHYALPQMRPVDGVWIEPRFGGEPIGIVHLVAEKMRETYLRHGMLYEGGDYLSPEEVPENLRAAFLAGRRRPVIGQGPGG